MEDWVYRITESWKVIVTRNENAPNTTDFEARTYAHIETLKPFSSLFRVYSRLHSSFFRPSSWITDLPKACDRECYPYDTTLKSEITYQLLYTLDDKLCSDIDDYVLLWYNYVRMFKQQSRSLTVIFDLIFEKTPLQFYLTRTKFTQHLLYFSLIFVMQNSLPISLLQVGAFSSPFIISFFENLIKTGLKSEKE